jgi:hypothetical protein
VPEGVKVFGDPDEVVAAVVQKVEVKEPTAAVVAPVEGGTEPEVITARKPTEEAKEEK